MAGIVRVIDICSGGVMSCSCSPNTYVNGLPVERFSDMLCDGALHCGTHSVYVNNRCIQACGDCNTDPCVMVTCSFNTFVD